MHIKIQFHHTSFTKRYDYVLHIIQTHQHTQVWNIIQCHHESYSVCDYAVRCPLFVEVLSWLRFLFLLVGRAEKGMVFKVDHLTLPYVHLIHCNTGVLYKQDKTTSVRKDKLAVLKEKQGNKMFFPFSQLIICKQHVIRVWMLLLINTIVGYT